MSYRHYYSESGAQEGAEVCPKEPGTIIRVFIPAGAVVDLGPLRISSPTGICLVISVPLLGDLLEGVNLANIVEWIQAAGGTVEVIDSQG